MFLYNVIFPEVFGSEKRKLVARDLIKWELGEGSANTSKTREERREVLEQTSGDDGKVKCGRSITS